MTRQVLIVDDSSSMRALVCGTLQTLGCQVHEAANGQQALQMLQALDKVDLIVTDLNMPVMDGITFVQSVRKLDALRFTPVLLLTTETSKEKRHHARAAGATGWLTKPFNPQQLADAVERMLL